MSLSHSFTKQTLALGEYFERSVVGQAATHLPTGEIQLANAADMPWAQHLEGLTAEVAADVIADVAAGGNARTSLQSELETDKPKEPAIVGTTGSNFNTFG